jgi:predicted adenine nucleotide alpha hydrolase (AANH) superfamily ATPase
MSIIKLAFQQYKLEKDANALAEGGNLITSTLMQNGKKGAAQLLNTDIGETVKQGVSGLANFFKKKPQVITQPKRALHHLGQAYMGTKP